MPKKRDSGSLDGYTTLHGGIVDLLETARRMVARTINTVMTATYWESGQRIVEAQQKGKRRAGHGERLIERLTSDLTKRFGRGFCADNLELTRLFYLTYPPSRISELLIRKSQCLGGSAMNDWPKVRLGEVLTIIFTSHAYFIILARKYERSEAQSS
ncbi:MAG: hypothetical protein C0394_10545 [Syntrophus sp. (in: bacteria)]|nr:hypothetical protein [Syntrophus sp. (in: bacteria)]